MRHASAPIAANAACVRVRRRAHAQSLVGRDRASQRAMRVAVELKNAYRLVNHGPVVLVSAAHDGNENVMAVAWCMALDFSPPKLAIVLAQDTFTRSLVDHSGELVVQ